MRTKVYPLEKVEGYSRWDSISCQVTSNIAERDKFISSVYQKTYKIDHQFDCNEKCVFTYILARFSLSRINSILEVA